MRGTIVFGALFGLVGLGGCVSTPVDAPEWFAERSAANDSSYPALRSVPRDTIANTDANHWQQVETDLVAAGAQVKANPRAVPATQTQDPAAFLEEAREDLEEARQAHEQ